LALQTKQSHRCTSTASRPPPPLPSTTSTPHHTTSHYTTSHHTTPHLHHTISPHLLPNTPRHHSAPQHSTHSLFCELPALLLAFVLLALECVILLVLCVGLIADCSCVLGLCAFLSCIVYSASLLCAVWGTDRVLSTCVFQHYVWVFRVVYVHFCVLCVGLSWATAQVY
jgi:hypothetical protein